MKVIFILTKSITFNSFLKSQADYFIKKGIKVEIACSDIKNLNFKYNFKHKIDFPSKWTNSSVPFLSRLSFAIMGVIRKYYWLYVSYRDVNPQKVYKELLEKHQ